MRCVASSLRGSGRPLAETHDVALLDLDGVVYVGADAVPGVPAALGSARAHGLQLAFVTNNASRTPQQVAAHLTELGIEAHSDEVITSAQAAARWLAEHLGPSARVLVVGTAALADALREQGLSPASEAQPSDPDGRRRDVAAVVQGYSPDTNWRMLAEGAVAIRAGAVWVATNADPTVPSARGPLPGNGSMVAALRHATGAKPIVTGKPDPTMHRETLLRTGAKHPLVVGDRLDTDIEGANAVGCASLLVLSGVTAPDELVAAPPRLRPTFLAADAAGLLDPQPEPEYADGAVRVGRWKVTATGGDCELRAAGARRGETSAESARYPADDLDALRAVCAARWSDDSTNETGRVTAADADARAVLDRLGLGKPPAR
jgi:HAD superfamily hydrolase (TIGR01450 family)